MIQLAPYEVRARFLIDWAKRVKRASDDDHGKWANAYVCRTHGTGRLIKANLFREV